MSSFVKLVVFVPSSHAHVVRQAMGNAGAGTIGNYSHCTFSTVGKGRYKPLPGAKPFIGKVGTYETVDVERIETVCLTENVKKIISAMKKVHPDEEIDYDIYPLLDKDYLA